MTFVCATGAVAACCSRWRTIGNINSNSFEDIWNGAPRRRIILSILNGRPEAECDDCPQIRGADYANKEEDFLKPANADAGILKERDKSFETLPSLKGLDSAFRGGVAALVEGHIHTALKIFSDLDAQFPDFFEIKNNLAVAHLYHGDAEICRELFDVIRRIPHGEQFMESNSRALETLIRGT
jgi:hypothetical protein